MCGRGNARFLAWEDGSLAGTREAGVVCSLGERRVGGFLEERGCVMSTWISPKFGLSRPHQFISLTEGTFLSAIVVLAPSWLKTFSGSYYYTI